MYQILKDIVTPFSHKLNNRIIGDMIYFPIKLLSALLLAIFIYFYLAQLCINISRALR